MSAAFLSSVQWQSICYKRNLFSYFSLLVILNSVCTHKNSSPSISTPRSPGPTRKPFWSESEKVI